MAEEADSGKTPALTLSDEHLLGLIREGRVDAEIAVRMGISNAEVKARIERMLAQSGLRQRSDFITPPEPETSALENDASPIEQKPRTLSVHNAVLAVVGALAMGVSVGWVIRDKQAGEQSDQVSVPDGGIDPDGNAYIIRLPTPGVVVLPKFQPALGSSDTKPPISGTNLGALFLSSIGGPQPTVNLDRDAAGHQVVAIAGNARIGTVTTLPWRITRRSTSDVVLEQNINGSYLTLTIEAADEFTRVGRVIDLITITSTGPDGPRVKLWVEGAPWLFTADGRLVVYL